MSSATDIPAENPATQGTAEDEPLLGRAGDASQQGGKTIAWNLVLGISFMFFSLSRKRRESSRWHTSACPDSCSNESLMLT